MDKSNVRVGRVSSSVVLAAAAVAMTASSALASFPIGKGSFTQAPRGQGVFTVGGVFVPTVAGAKEVDPGKEFASDGSAEIDRSWATAASGDWATGTNWTPAGAPLPASNLTVGLPGTYTISNLAGTANSLNQTNGNVTYNGGTIEFLSAVSPGVGAGGPLANTSLRVSGTAAATVSGGAVVTIGNGYVGEQLTDNASLTITGTGSLVRAFDLTASTGAAPKGRFGSLRGNATLNVTNGGGAEARLFEFGRQNGGTTTVNVNTGGRLGNFTTGGTADPTAFPQIVLPRGESTTMNLNIASAGTVEVGTLFSGATAAATASTGNISITGANSRLRVNNVMVTNGGGGAGANFGTTTINVSNGGTLSLGRLNGNQDGGSVGNVNNAVTNVTVDGVGSTFELRDSNGFTNNYLVLGQGAWSSGNVTIRNGAALNITPTGTGGAFASIASADNTVASLNIQSGGTATMSTLGVAEGIQNSVGTVAVTGTGSTMTVSGQVVVGGGVIDPNVPGPTPVGNVGNLTVSNGATFNAASNATAGFFTSLDQGNVTNITVESTAVANVGANLLFNGGNGSDLDNFGAGVTNLTIRSGGVLNVGDAMFAHTEGGLDASNRSTTTILIEGAGSRLNVNGVDNELDPGIDAGFYASGDVNTSETVTIRDGGVMFNLEGAFIGDGTGNNSTWTIQGAGSKYDSGGLLRVGPTANTVSNSVITMSIESGGSLETTVGSDNLAGPMLLGIDASSGSSLTINITGAGSKLDSAATIDVGGIFGDLDNNPATPATLQQGIATTVTSGAGSIIRARDQVYVAPGSTLNIGGDYEVLGVATDGIATFIDGVANISSTGSVKTGWLGVDKPTAGSAPVFGELTINAPTGHAVVQATRVDVTSGASIDLRTSDAIIVKPTVIGTAPNALAAQTVADIKALIVAGRNNGAHDGVNGIRGEDVPTSNREIGYAPVTAAGTFLGVSVAVGDIIVRNTLLGDANLDGSVGFTDLVELARNYNSTTGDWFTGDFDYSGGVNFADLVALARNYNSSLTASGDVLLGDTSTFAADWALAQSMVPEPATLGLVAGAAVLGLRRRRR